MKLLATLDDYSLGFSTSSRVNDDGYTLREAARAIVFNDQGKTHFFTHLISAITNYLAAGLKKVKIGKQPVFVKPLKKQGSMFACAPLRLARSLNGGAALKRGERGRKN